MPLSLLDKNDEFLNFINKLYWIDINDTLDVYMIMNLVCMSRMKGDE